VRAHTRGWREKVFLAQSSARARCSVASRRARGRRAPVHYRALLEALLGTPHDRVAPASQRYSAMEDERVLERRRALPR
jgi:hypothetical protein